MKDFDIHIVPQKKMGHFWRELYDYRELFFFLAWRDILIRYKQTVIGVAWSVLKPLLTMAVFTIVFGKLAKMPSGGIPYSILVFSALLPWHFFSSTINDSGNSLTSNSNLISKVYFPRIIIPTTSVVVSSIDFLISFGLLSLLMVYHQYVPTWGILLLPLFYLQAVITTLGISYIISSLNVKYRDFKYITPFMIQFGLYISPVGFQTAIIPESWRILYSINPLVGVIDGFRWAVLGEGFMLYIPGYLVSLGCAILLFGFGLTLFLRTEREFADYI